MVAPLSETVRARNGNVLTKWYEMVCDGCGSAEHFQGSRECAEAQAREYGWIVSRKGHWCSEECRTKVQKSETHVQ